MNDHTLMAELLSRLLEKRINAESVHALKYQTILPPWMYR